MSGRKLIAWADQLYTLHAPAIARMIGVDQPQAIRIHVAGIGPGAAWTNGLDVTLSAAWFVEHPEDAGACLHEFTHSIMRAPVYDATTRWLIEGIADWVRDELGEEMPWTFAHYEPGMATAGYQTTAHFLQWLENTYPGTVQGLASALSRGTYGEPVWLQITGRSLDLCVSGYEADQQR